MTFGSGNYGCLGHGNFNDVSQAKIVEKLLGVEVSMVGFICNVSFSRNLCRIYIH